MCSFRKVKKINISGSSARENYPFARFEFKVDVDNYAVLPLNTVIFQAMLTKYAKSRILNQYQYQNVRNNILKLVLIFLQISPFQVITLIP